MTRWTAKDVLRSSGVPAKGLVGVERRKMNKTERAYESAFLRPGLLAGEIIWYEFERMTFLLGNDTRYTPDFVVQLASGEMEIHEVKGAYIREDARVKVRCCATQFPFRVILAQLMDDGRWVRKTM